MTQSQTTVPSKDNYWKLTECHLGLSSQILHTVNMFMWASGQVGKKKGIKINLVLFALAYHQYKKRKLAHAGATTYHCMQVCVHVLWKYYTMYIMGLQFVQGT